MWMGDFERYFLDDAFQEKIRSIGFDKPYFEGPKDQQSKRGQFGWIFNTRVRST